MFCGNMAMLLSVDDDVGQELLAFDLVNDIEQDEENRKVFCG